MSFGPLYIEMDGDFGHFEGKSNVANIVPGQAPQISLFMIRAQDHSCNIKSQIQ